MSIIARVRPVAVKALQQKIAVAAATARLSKVPVRSFSGGIEYTDGEDVVLSGRQYELAILGNFPDTPTIQPFGTMKQPAMIYSGHKSRIVGCIGGGPYSHRLKWFNLKEGPKHVCPDCGQVFKLVTDNNYHEVKHLVDRRTREHFDYFNTLAHEGKVPLSAAIKVGQDSKY